MAGRNASRSGGLGQDGAGREQVSEIQRARLVLAMGEVAAERGYPGASIAHVVARAGVSRRTFYEQFADREDCLLASLDVALKRLAAHVVPAYEQPGSWRERIRAALIELLSFLDDDPVTGRLVIVEGLAAGPRALERRRNVLAQVIAAVEQGRGPSKRGEEPPPLTGEGVVGGVLSLIHTRLFEGPPMPLIELCGPLMSMIVLPYLGPAAARRELSRPVPRGHDGARPLPSDPLRELPMRLTYRTIRVLLAVGAHPGASNRQVADASGIRDPGQISKLLARLQRLGLIRNARPTVKGEPNSWTLTERGAAVQEAISIQTEGL